MSPGRAWNEESLSEDPAIAHHERLGWTYVAPEVLDSPPIGREYAEVVAMAPSNDRTMYYDGALRPLHEVTERVERDARQLLEQAVAEWQERGFWGLLLRDVPLPRDLDPFDEATFSRGYIVNASEANLYVKLARQPRTLAAAHEVLRRLPWCRSARRLDSSVELVVDLDEAALTLLQTAIASGERAASRAMGAIVSRCEAIVSPLPAARVFLAEARAQLPALTQAKLARVARHGARSP